MNCLANHGFTKGRTTLPFERPNEDSQCLDQALIARIDTSRPRHFFRIAAGSAKIGDNR